MPGPFGAGFDDAVAALRGGGAAIIPTDTVFGLAISPYHAPGPEMLFLLKGRPSDKPVAWLLADADGLDEYGQDVPEYAHCLAKRHWPGALTLVVRASAAVPRAFQSQDGTIGLRVPDDLVARALAREAGGALAVTSANPSGRPAPHRFLDIDPMLIAQVGAAIDDGTRKSGVASTVVDCTGRAPRILREGDIGQGDIEGPCD